MTVPPCCKHDSYSREGYTLYRKEQMLLYGFASMVKYVQGVVLARGLKGGGLREFFRKKMEGGVFFAADVFTAAVWCVPFSGAVGLFNKLQTQKKKVAKVGSGRGSNLLKYDLTPVPLRFT